MLPTRVRVARAVALLAALAGTAAGCGGPDVCGGEGVVCTVVGNGVTGLDQGEDTPVLDAPLYWPMDVAVAPDGAAYLMDWNNHRIRRWDRDAGTVRTVAGTGWPIGGPPGPALESGLIHPSGVAFEPGGTIIVAAWHNHRVKRFDPVAGTIVDVGGTGNRGFCGDGGPALSACLDLPSSAAVDDAGNLYFSDQGNNRIRRIDSAGTITTYAGTGLGGGDSASACVDADIGGTLDCFGGDDGPAIDATLNNLRGDLVTVSGRLAIVPGGDLYVADTGNHVIRRIDAATGMITTVAGTGRMRGYAGDGGPATAALLAYPIDVAVDPRDGTLLIADTGNDCIRAVGPDGVIRTAAGVCGERGYDGDGAPAAGAHFEAPYGVEVTPDGTLLVSDTENSVVRAVYPPW